MNIFFGKISQKIDIAQLSEGYYSSNKGSSWFGELELGDYVYLIGGEKVQFWQAREWGVRNGRESLLFDVLSPDLGINVSQLIALKFLKITKTLAVLTSRSARNKAFFKLEMITDIPISNLSNKQYYKNVELYRSIRIINRADLIEESEDIQLIYENNKLQLVDNYFIENTIKKEFVDNLDKKGKGAVMKDNVLEFFSNAIKNLPTSITYKDIGLRSFYDTFFCDYKEKSILENEEINYWIFQGNPKIFNTVDAVNSNAVKTWTVSSHKDKIKKGDKFILWLTGANAGCYAMGRVDSEVTLMKEDNVEMSYYLSPTPQTDNTRVNIIIEHNFVYAPVLWESIKENEVFKDFKGSNQGTNFTATKEQFETLLALGSKPKKYWLYAPGEKANKWEDFYAEGIMGLGWDELGDLKGYSSKAEINKKLQAIENTTDDRKNGAIANYEFSNVIAIGDIIIAKKGRSELIGYGEVTSECIYNAKRESYKNYRKVNWKLKGEWDAGHNLALKTLTDITNFTTEDPKHTKYYERLLAIMEGNSSNKVKDMNDLNFYKAPLNQILYGPPGTGKTYNTINKSLAIIENKAEAIIKGEGRKDLKKRYDQYIKEGRIVFTTFHQSMSYEDFIEGIKPKIDENEEGEKQVIYDVENGIFKQLVEHARKPNTVAKETLKSYSFDDGWDHLISDANKHIEENNPLFLSIQSPKLGLKIVDISGGGNLKLKPIYSEEAKEYTVSYSRTKKLQEAFPDLSVIKNIDKEFRAVIGGSNSTAYWSVLNYINQRIKENKKTEIQETTLPVLPYVLIIDEINRGNVSQIFGELITLIEEDKRLGKDEALEVILPYSKEIFGVPPNLYIIGTMNTADRSVEALDTALRRRFSFEEMPPRSKVVEKKAFDDYPRAAIMEKINNRIELLLDRNHTLGHAYFIKANFKNSFENEIIPLLQEYFYNDYGKIGLVLGKGFVRDNSITKSNGQSIFADFETKNEVDIVKSYELIPFAEVEFETALQTLLA